MKVIIDTNFFYALYVEKDIFHQKALALLETIQEKTMKTPSLGFLTNQFVVQETYTLMNYRIKQSHFLHKLDELFFGKARFFELYHSNSHIQEMKQIIQVMKDYIGMTPKRNLSFTDASLIHHAKLLGVNQILSFDGHFKNILEYFNKE